MKLLVSVALLLAATLAIPSAQQKAAGPMDAYKAYLAVLANAKSLDELIPHYTKELGGLLGKMPKDQQANYLKMNKRTLKDLKVTSETVDDNKAVYMMTATDNGRPASGKVTLVKEGGAWKIDDDAWATSTGGDDGELISRLP